MSAEGTFRLIFDRGTRRPYCVLLQAAYGGDSHAVSRFFDTDIWLLSPTGDPIGVEGTAEQLRSLNANLVAAGETGREG